MRSLWEHHWDSWMRCCWCCLLIRCSPRWVPHRCSGGAVPWRGPWGLRLQRPSDRWVHINDHRLHYGGHLCPIYAASVPHGLSVAFYTLPSSAGRWRFLWWHIPPKVSHIYTQKDFSAYKTFRVSKIDDIDETTVIITIYVIIVKMHTHTLTLTHTHTHTHTLTHTLTLTHTHSLLSVDKCPGTVQVKLCKLCERVCLCLKLQGVCSLY